MSHPIHSGNALSSQSLGLVAYILKFQRGNSRPQTTMQQDETAHKQLW